MPWSEPVRWTTGEIEDGTSNIPSSNIPLFEVRDISCGGSGESTPPGMATSMSLNAEPPAPDAATTQGLLLNTNPGVNDPAARTHQALRT